MQTDVCIRIINGKLNKNIWVAGFSVIPAIIAFGFSNTSPKWQWSTQQGSSIS